MGSNGASEIHNCNVQEGSETTIEIKIKTLDSQTYTLRVNKQMPVPELKEQIASVTGVLCEQQRLICRGRVLKDDQLLSAYHVEDGHTLHLVTRQPIPLSESLNGNDPAPSSSPGRRIQVAPGIVVETFDVTGHSDAVHSDINRIVSAVLGAFGINETRSATAGENIQTRGSGAHERTLSDIGVPHVVQLQREQAGLVGQSDRSNGTIGGPPTIALGSLHPRVIPDSLTTLSQYLIRMRQEYTSIGESNGQDATSQETQTRQSGAPLPSIPVPERLPTPEFLADILQSTRETLVDQIAESLLQLSTQLRDQLNVTDSTQRQHIQSNAWRSGLLFQNLGAFLLELGRTTMTLRMGQTPSEAMVNAGPSVFVSQSGPNPLMVQPLPFQPGASFGVISRPPGSSLGNDNAAGLYPRRIDIQIRRGSSTGERGSLPPVRAMVAAVPSPISRLPGLGRFQHVVSGHVTDRRGVPASNEHQQAGLQTEVQPPSDSGVQPPSDSGVQLSSDSGLQQNTREHFNDGNLTNAEQGTLPVHSSRRLRFSVLSTNEHEIHQPSERDVHNEVYQILGALFPGSDIQVEDNGQRTAATTPATENLGVNGNATASQEIEPRASDEGIFLSSLLRRVMPHIPQQSGGMLEGLSVENASEQTTMHESSNEAENSNVGTSHQRDDATSDQPKSKRQKME